MLGAEPFPNSRSHHIAQSHGIVWFRGIWSKGVHYLEPLSIAPELAGAAHCSFLFLDWAGFPGSSLLLGQFRSVLPSCSRSQLCSDYWFMSSDCGFIYFYFKCLGTLSACMSVHRICTWCPQRLEEAIGSPGTGCTTYGCELLVGGGN